ncbi:permease for cytosine/purines, uracil, thiamine, allantoin-domain-containing protein [Colletotrichum godetiae]|uniref:Permease for cytosine/purines, uracil, thiamine, allantoin-domain-containing protein n=1 Tax=Colletotrichum godetiae TaxID=1209918 RepID=A0AAJ0EV51_9PEZI|nr:permease for cytosine/purines, uracil, thiamine, allantoin-domain-containing protein [Colletotrichum godetiae]KAK1674993.1 permease for cytosine/purines, uracil, thiamine, allantoin-domain-containing protein [Colletotrichum godetiae]
MAAGHETPALVDLEKKLGDDADNVSIGAGSQDPPPRSWLTKLPRALLSSAETRGVAPVPIEERTVRNTLQLFTLWLTANCTTLPMTTGISGTLVFGLDLAVASAVIVISTLIFMLPIAWLGTMGPKTGMRQMIQTRYYFSYYFAVGIALLQIATLIGYTIMTSIVSGQTLTAVSQGDLSLAVGITTSVVGALPISFLGYKYLHYIDQYLWAPSLVALIIVADVRGKSFARTGAESVVISPRSFLTFAAACASLCTSWAPLVSDFAVYIDPYTPRFKIFLCVYACYSVPSILLLILGAAAGAAVPGNDAWAEAYGLYSVGGIINAMNSPLGGFGKFVSVLLAFSVLGLTACTLYSLSISFQSLYPILSRLPRYLYSVVIVAIIVPISIVASSNFYNSLSNFLSVVGYWTASYSSIALTEHFCFRRGRAYNVSNWDNPKAIPLGFAAVVSLCCSFGLIVPFMETMCVGS